MTKSKYFPVLYLIFISILFLNCTSINEVFMAKTKISTEYDEFKNQTTFKLENVHNISSDQSAIISGAPYISFSIIGTGNSLGKATELLVQFWEINKTWLFLNCTQTIFLIDGERIDLGSPEHNGSVIQGNVYESMFYLQPISFLNKIAHATSVKFKICNSVFQIDDKGLAYIKDYYNQILSKR